MPATGSLHRIFVVGVGYLGSRLLSTLEYGAGLNREPRPDIDRPIEVLDLDNDDIPVIDLGDFYSIVYTVPPAADDRDSRLEKFLAGLESVPERFVYISTTGVYGDCNGELLDETRTLSPKTDRARRRAAAEDLLNRWTSKNGVELIVLRVPGIYGPGRLGVERIRNATPLLVEDDANPGNRIHVDDLVSCCSRALSPGMPEGAYNVGDGDMRSSTWFANEVARQCSLPPPPTVTREEAEKTFSATRLSFLRESRRLDLTKMHEVLGVTPKHPNAADGIAASLRASAGDN